jgi:RNA polymerase sigma-70 factor, ECF subfamily
MIDWERIVHDDGPAVWRTAQRLLGNRADADECFQETFAAAVELTRRADAGPIRKWRSLLVRLATARAVDRLRQRIWRTSRETSDETAVDRLVDHHDSSRPHVRAEQAEMSVRLRAALAHLPPKQADAFCLHCLEGWSYREVAEHLEESIDHVGVLIHRARAALQDRIASILPDRSPGAAVTD